MRNLVFKKKTREAKQLKKILDIIKLWPTLINTQIHMHAHRESTHRDTHTKITKFKSIIYEQKTNNVKNAQIKQYETDKYQ